ncbi:carcinoembryonic antigen-related cell adhesion molecule 16-like isoform X2 [Tachyglossus aculeatus]|uniref:carcinoembryonic antigen-related cell adhesion molecule 16-like isoform X2 n=1 Tax=Tachyglossus aculeatus TaxID=9261 RepID=UPI0018F68A8A|nr:carcinoembryonic antigen-related cell adhesion molecule 16-like isoform X2 [Tachyglossus aculeatus]
MAFPQGHGAPPGRTARSWARLLLAASILTAGVRPAAPLTVPPAVAAVGDNVTLTAHGHPANVGVYNWYRRTSLEENLICKYLTTPPSQTLGKAHTGRESVRPDGSLLITSVTVNDTGPYSVDIVFKNFTFTSSRVELQVDGGSQEGNFRTRTSRTAQGHTSRLKRLSQPSLTASYTDAVEHRDSVTFWCLPGDPSDNLFWFVNNTDLMTSDRLELYSGNRTLTVHNVTRGDAGTYQCEARDMVSAQRSNLLTLTVSYGPDSVVILNQPQPIEAKLESTVIIWCHAPSLPAAQYRWYVNGTSLGSPENYLTILRMSWKQQGNYTCLAHNRQTQGAASASVFLSVAVEAPILAVSDPSLSGGTIAGITIGALAGGLLIAVLGYFLITTKGRRQLGEPTGEPGLGEGSPPAPNTSKSAVFYVNLHPTEPAPSAQGRSLRPLSLEAPTDCSLVYKNWCPTDMNIYCKIKPSA